MLVDSHAHLNLPEFKADLSQVIGRCRDKNVAVINVGSQAANSGRALELARENKNFFAAVGLHPETLTVGQAMGEESFSPALAKEQLEKISHLAESEQTVAIGEIGLDYFHLPAGEEAATKKLQQEYLFKLLAVAQANELPAILHCRGAKERPLEVYQELLAFLKNQPVRGVLHCFGADWPLAQEFLAAGFYLGVTGIVTFKKGAETLQEVAAKMPLERLLIETDCPFLAPEPYRGQRNEPAYVELVAKKIAELRKISLDEVIEATTQSAQELFSLKFL